MGSDDIILVYGDAAGDQAWAGAIDQVDPDAPRYRLAAGQLIGYTPPRFGYLAILRADARKHIPAIRKATGHGATDWRFSPITGLIGDQSSNLASDLANRHVLPTLTVPFEGRMQDLDDWYTTHHVPEVTQVAGYAVGRRYRSTGSDQGGPPLEHERLALYEIEGDDPKPALRRLETSLGDMVQTDALDAGRILSWCYSPI